MKRGAVVVVAGALALAACGSDKKPAGGGTGTGTAAGSSLAAEANLSALGAGAGLEVRASDVAADAVAVTPVLTSSVTFAVPKADVTWMELSFPCYGAGATMSGDGGSPAAPIEAVSPLIPVVMAKAGIDLATDLAAIGGYACGADRPCIYFALRFAAPDRMKAALEAIPGVTVAEHGPGHYGFAAPGAQGQRDIHVRVVPIRWPAGRVADDPWNAAQLRATHVVFVTGLFGGDDVDPLTMLHAPADAAAKVATVESLQEQRSGRCMVGAIGHQDDVKPGFDLERGRFLVAAPLGAGDALGRLLGSKRTLAMEIELTLEPAPTAADLTRWTAEARQWVAGIVDPLRQQFAGQGPAVELTFDMGGMLVEHGFRPTLTGKDLRLSWRTDRVPASALDDLERRFQSVLGTP